MRTRLHADLGGQLTALRQSEEKHRSILDNAPVGIFESTPEGKLLYVNCEYARIMGYGSPQDIIDTVNRKSVAEVLYMTPALRPRFVRDVMVGGGWNRYENRYRRFAAIRK